MKACGEVNTSVALEEVFRWPECGGGEACQCLKGVKRVIPLNLKFQFPPFLQNLDAAQVTLSGEKEVPAAAAASAVALARESAASRETARRDSYAGGIGPLAPALSGWTRSTRTTHAAHTKVLSQCLCLSYFML